MILAIEDQVSEAVARKLVTAIRPDLTITVAIGNKGNTYLRGRAGDLNQTARKVPVFLLTDQDRPDPCPADLISSWLAAPAQRNLLFRVAVMEIESWVLADRDHIADFLAVPEHRVPRNPDDLPNPKEFIVSLARRSRRKDIREDLVPPAGSTSAFGPAFNPRLVSFVESTWDGRTAAQASPSLRRAVDRLSTAFSRP